MSKIKKIKQPVYFLTKLMIAIPNRGFSLVELLVVISIIGLVTAVGTSFVSSLQRNTRDSQREADLRILQAALQQYYADQNKYPGDDIGNLTSLKSPDGSKTYLTQIPKDPVGTAYYYRPVISISQPLNSCGPAIGTCHYYFLCAKLENPNSGTTCSAPGGGANNFQVTPL